MNSTGPPVKGRGAQSNRSGRFEALSREAFDDGWELSEDEPARRPLATTVSLDHTRSILTRNDSPDIPFDQSLNPYRGCEHGCAYCFARPTHAYLGLSPGLDFETKLLAKPRAAELLRHELAKPSYVCRPIAMGTNTDPYQPIEREHRITRAILEVCLETEHPVSIVTKSANILRDLDLLTELARRGLALVFLSVTTLDRGLAGALEPRASRPQRRLDALSALSAAGVPVGVLSSPMIPGLNDHELEEILAAAQRHGARQAGYVLLRLPLEIKELFAEWLEQHAPDRAARVLALVRQTYDGKLYDARFGVRGKGSGPYAALIARRFEVACQRLGLARERIELDTTRFRRPSAPRAQLALF
ncbi:MAG: PA0069 family radical SAM protein [Kofleriaceae bacterium]